MIRRPAVTLIEVLVSLFIMAIGMLALLVLFPLGAISMAQALKDDRCASTASMAENVAIAMNVRHDSLVQPTLASSSVVYVDPYGVLIGYTTVGSSAIPRVTTSFVGPTTPSLRVPPFQLADRWFSLPDDIGFSASGTPDLSTTGGIIDRGRRYSYAYLLRQLPGSDNPVNLTVAVYSARPVGSLMLETSISATPPGLPVLGTAGTNSLTLPVTGTTIKHGGWLLDTSSSANTPVPVATGYFYRVIDFAEAGGITTVEVQPNLIGNVGQITIMDDVVEVFDKGTGWQP